MAELFDSLPGLSRAVFNCILQPIGSSSDVTSGLVVGPVVLDKRVKFPDLRLNRSREILPETVGGCIFDAFSRKLPTKSSGDIVGVAVEYVRMDVHVKFGDSGSNRCRDIRAAHFVTNEGMQADGPCCNRQQRLTAFFVKQEYQENPNGVSKTKCVANRLHNRLAGCVLIQ